MCESHGWSHLFVPVLSFDFGAPSDVQMFRNKINNISTYAYVVFTSATALHACQNAFGPTLPSALLKTPTFVVGPATARAATNAGFEYVCIPEDDSGNAKVLAPYIAECMSLARTQEHTVTVNIWNKGPTQIHMDATKPGLLLLARMRLPTLTTILTAMDEPHEVRVMVHTHMVHTHIFVTRMSKHSCCCLISLSRKYFATTQSPQRTCGLISQRSTRHHWPQRHVLRPSRTQVHLECYFRPPV